MTKQEEIDTLNAFIRTLPGDSYLKPMLDQCFGEMSSAIRNDFACIDFHARLEEQREHQREILALSKKRDELQRQISDLTGKCVRHQQTLNNIVAEARRICS